MKILGIIPARGGSKGVPKKNLKLLNGKPLFQYTWDAVKKLKTIDRIILSSEDSEIIKLAKYFGIDVPFKRPEHLATDQATSIDVVTHALRALEPEHFDAVCLMQPTTPFRDRVLVLKCIEKLIAEELDAVISVREVPHQYNPHWVFEEGSGQLLNPAIPQKTLVSRRQELPKAYYRDGQVYVTKTSVLKEQQSFLGTKTGFVVSENEPYINIDTMADWNRAEQLLKDH